MYLSLARQWWRMHLIPALGRQRQEDIYEFQVSLAYILSLYLRGGAIEVTNSKPLTAGLRGPNPLMWSAQF